MLPKWHILFGVILSVLIWIAVPKINLFHLLLLFFSSFLIDFDHYMCAIINTRKFRLSEAYEYHKEMDKLEEKRRKEGIKQRGDFHLFHTIEFHVLVGILSIFWIGFFYIFLGMMFHSLTDLYSLLYSSQMYKREFFLTNWLRQRINLAKEN